MSWPIDHLPCRVRVVSQYSLKPLYGRCSTSDMNSLRVA